MAICTNLIIRGVVQASQMRKSDTPQFLHPKFRQASFGRQAKKPYPKDSKRMSMYILSDFLEQGFQTSEGSATLNNTSNKKNWCM